MPFVEHNTISRLCKDLTIALIKFGYQLRGFKFVCRYRDNPAVVLLSHVCIADTNRECKHKSAVGITRDQQYNFHCWLTCQPGSECDSKSSICSREIAVAAIRKACVV